MDGYSPQRYASDRKEAERENKKKGKIETCNAFSVSPALATLFEDKIAAMMLYAVKVGEEKVAQLPKSSLSEPPYAKRDRLIDSVDDEWRSGRTLASAVGLSASYALKLLDESDEVERRRERLHRGRLVTEYRRVR